jgi:predicted nucleotidyltransferase
MRQRAVLDQIIARAAGVEPIDGLIVIGSFAGGEPDALSDLDLIAAATPGRLEEAWDARHRLAGDALVTWEPRSNEGRDVRWLNWLTHDLVKVACGFAAPGSKELAMPFAVVLGPDSVGDALPRIDPEIVEERAARRREEQQVFDPDQMTPEERSAGSWPS